MPYGRHAKGGVRSHRRRRRLIVAPWIIISVTGALVLSGMSAGYAYLATRGCDGKPITATVVASPDVSKLLDNLSRRWADTQPSVHGRCSAVEVIAKDSAEAANALGSDWDPRRDGTRPDAWVPESSAWMRMASVREDASKMIPDLQPSLARTPAVIAMPRPMADALDWPKDALNWRSLLGKFSSGKGWSQYKHPEWGAFKIAMTDPAESTAGLHALMAIADADDDGEVTDAEIKQVSALKDSITAHQPNTEAILGDLTRADATGEKQALQYISAFPALERDVLQYNQTNPRVPLAAVYPPDGAADADHPFLTLNAPWSDKDRQEVATEFRDFLRGGEGRQAFLDDGFRDANRKPGRDLSPSNGVIKQVTTLPRAVLLPESVTQTVATWSALNARMNVLLVVDVSESMGDPVLGTGKTKLEVAGEAIKDAVRLFGSQAQVGLWEFSSGLDGNKDYSSVVSLGPVSDPLDGATRQQAIIDSVDDLDARGGSGLYDTALAAFEHVKENYLPGARNLVLLLSDGADDTNGMTLQELTGTLTGEVDKTKPVQIAPLAYGGNVDFSALRAISNATGGRTYPSRNPNEVSKTLLTALFGQ